MPGAPALTQAAMSAPSCGSALLLSAGMTPFVFTQRSGDDVELPSVDSVGLAVSSRPLLIMPWRQDEAEVPQAKPDWVFSWQPLLPQWPGVPGANASS